MCVYESRVFSVLRAVPDSLLVEGTAAAGGRSIFVEGAGEILVQSVSHAAWYALPG